MSDVTITNWLIILAIILGPVLAVVVTMVCSHLKEIRQRKLTIFKTLMATRADSTSRNHVNALNTIDLEFDNKEKEVLSSWKEYRDFLYNSKHREEISYNLWQEERENLLATLLHNMALALKYDFDKAHIKNYSYSPTAHGDLEYENSYIRKGIIEILEGKKSLPMHITQLPKNDDDSKNH